MNGDNETTREKARVSGVKELYLTPDPVSKLRAHKQLDKISHYNLLQQWRRKQVKLLTNSRSWWQTLVNRSHEIAAFQTNRPAAPLQQQVQVINVDWLDWSNSTIRQDGGWRTKGAVRMTVEPVFGMTACMYQEKPQNQSISISQYIKNKQLTSWLPVSRGWTEKGYGYDLAKCVYNWRTALELLKDSKAELVERVISLLSSLPLPLQCWPHVDKCVLT